MARCRIRALALCGLSALAGCGGGGSSPTHNVSANLSNLQAQPSFGALADGLDPVTVTVTVRDRGGDPLAGRMVVIAASGTGNLVSGPVPTGADGRAVVTLATTVAESKTIAALVDPGPKATQITATAQSTFVAFDPEARYVRTDGSDANDGLSPARAWATVAYAATQLTAGDTVYVGAGTYAGTVTVAAGGQPGDPLSLVGDTGGARTGMGGEVVVDALGAREGFELSGVSDVVVQGFTIQGSSSPAAPGGGIRLSSCSDVALRRNSIHSNDRGVFAQDSDGIEVEGNVIHANTAAGVTLRNSDDCCVLNNLIYANGGEGVLVQSNSQSARVKSNTLYANGADQVHVDGGSNTATVRNNVLADGLEDGIEVEFPSMGVSDHNLLWNHAGQNEKGVPVAPGNVFADPGFVSPAGKDGVLAGAGWQDDDFRLPGWSPAVDAGAAAANSVMTSSGTSLGEMTTRTDGLADGTAPDGPQLNLGFHYPAPAKTPGIQPAPVNGGAKTGARVSETGPNANSSVRAPRGRGHGTRDTRHRIALGLDARGLAVPTNPRGGNPRASGTSIWTATRRMRAGARGPVGVPGPSSRSF